MQPGAALTHWTRAIGDGVPTRRLDDGLVNRTWAVGAPPRYALQAVAPAFGMEVDGHIDAVTRTLAAAGLAAPRLVAGDDGRLSLPGDGGWHWRLLTWIDGVNHHQVPGPDHAAAAAALVARFHDALLATPAGEALPASDFHDTDARMAALEAAAGGAGDLSAADHDAFRRLHDSIRAAWRRWRTAMVPSPPLRPGHGDLKISNVLFHPGGPEAAALIDFDTLGRHTLEAELGDALRSWCNPAGEDTVAPRLDEALFEAVVAGYLGASGTITAAERAGIVTGFARLALELAARFLTDVVEDRYFAWNPALAPDRRAHNLLRAEGQLALAHLVETRRAALERIVAYESSR